MPGVMVVENSSKPLWLVKKLLSSINYDIAFETDNGFEAIEKYNVIQPDVVICDLTLTKSDGLNVLKEIKKSHPESKIVIVNSIQSPILDECKSSGANACLSIPFNMKEFVTLIIGIGKTSRIDSTVAPVIVDD